MRAVVTSKGQITIPKAIRELAHIASGTELDFQVTEDGYLIIRPLTHDISKLKGIAGQKDRLPVSLKAMKKSIEEGFEESLQ